MFVLEYSYRLKVLYWNIPPDQKFCTGIFLLTEYFVQGLQALYQADPSVEVFAQETGEYVIVALGELHLERFVSELFNPATSQSFPQS
jgi:hypothetical protein